MGTYNFPKKKELNKNVITAQEFQLPGVSGSIASPNGVCSSADVSQEGEED